MIGLLNRIRSWWLCRSGRHLEPFVPNHDSVMRWHECLLCGKQFGRRPITVRTL